MLSGITEIANTSLSPSETTTLRFLLGGRAAASAGLGGSGAPLPVWNASAGKAIVVTEGERGGRGAGCAAMPWPSAVGVPFGLTISPF